MSTSTIFTLITLGVSILIIRYATKLVFKFIGLLLLIPTIILALYFFDVAPFNKNLFARENLKQKFCSKEDMEDVCTCIVEPYTKLIEEKFADNELIEIEEKNYESAYVFTKLYKKLSIETAICSGSEDSAKTVINKFIKELTPFNISPDKAIKWLKMKSNKINSKEDRKKEIDKILFDEQ